MNFAQYVTGLRKAIRKKYGCDAVHLRTEAVELPGDDEMLWAGNVECFALLEYGGASQCYGWGVPADDTATEYVLVLHKGSVDTPWRAVQSWVLAKQGEGKPRHSDEESRPNDG
jgi:hypothetical protein